MEQLRATNPAETWLAQQFKVQMNAANGGVILVRFDLKSAGLSGYRFDDYSVIEHFGHLILVDKDKDYGEYLNIAGTIAGVLNEQIEEQARIVLQQARESLLILDALDIGDAEIARYLGIKLGESLYYYGTFADRIWGKWLESVADHLKTL